MEHSGETPASTPWTPTRGGWVGVTLVVATGFFIVALLGVTLAGRVVRAPPPWLALPVIFLPYLYALLALWIFALWCGLPDRKSLPVMLFVVVASAGLLWGPSWPARSADDPHPESFTVMTYNVQRLWGDAPGGDPLSCVVDAVNEANPQLLTLLEVSRQDLEVLSEELGLDCVFGDYFNVGGDRLGGQASCVRGDDWELAVGVPQRFLDAEPWHYVLAEVQGSGRTMNLLSVHLRPHALATLEVGDRFRDLGRGRLDGVWELGQVGAQTIEAQGGQSVALVERLQRFEDPTIMAGDFNSTRDGALHVGLRRHMLDAWERGGRGQGGTVRFLDWLPLRIDYVYVSREFSVLDARVPQVECSDHRPVVVRLALPEGSTSGNW